MISGFIGSVPTTTYGENIGVMAVTRVYSVYVIAGAAILSIIISFIGKLSALISTIPGTVIGVITVNIGNIELTGMVLACVIGMLLSLAFYLLDKLNLTND